MFRLTPEETDNLKSQNAISSFRHGGRRSFPLEFTQEGVAMLSGILNSPQAIHANIAIMRAFVRLRRMLTENRELARRLDKLEEQYDRRFKEVFDAIRDLMDPPTPPPKRIGYIPP